MDLVLPPSAAGLRIRGETPASITRFYLPHQPGIHIALAGYKHPTVQALITANKFEANRHASALLAALLTQYLEQFAEPVYLVPIPLSLTRYRTRGHNQVQTILDHLPTILPATPTMTPALARTWDTPPQVKQTGEKRRSNMRHAFRCRRAAKTIPAGSTVLILDDVLTTGATLESAFETLRPALAPDCSLQTLALAH